MSISFPAYTPFIAGKGRCCNEKEYLLIIKCSADNFEAVRSRIRQLHTYQVPEIIAIACCRRRSGLPVLAPYLRCRRVEIGAAETLIFANPKQYIGTSHHILNSLKSSAVVPNYRDVHLRRKAFLEKVSYGASSKKSCAPGIGAEQGRYHKNMLALHGYRFLGFGLPELARIWRKNTIPVLFQGEGLDYVGGFSQAGTLGHSHSAI